MSTMKNFEIVKELGKGAFAAVSLVKRKEDQKVYALKRVKITQMSPKERENALNEVRLLASVPHVNIIGYKESFFDEETKTLNIVMEFADDGDLEGKIQKHVKGKTNFPENEVWSILIQIVQGIKALHDNKIMHRDLKSANIFMMKNGLLKLGDFNVSKVIKNSNHHTQTGTPYYCAPEIWSDKPYDYKCDVWSVGCVIYELCALRPPFGGNSLDQLYKNIMKGIYTPIPSIYSRELSNMLALLLQVKTSSRPTCDEILGNPSILKRLDYTKNLGMNEKAQLLSTIKMPKNINEINKQLPKKHYNAEAEGKDKKEEASKESSSKELKDARDLDSNVRRMVDNRNKENLYLNPTSVKDNPSSYAGVKENPSYAVARDREVVPSYNPSSNEPRSKTPVLIKEPPKDAVIQPRKDPNILINPNQYIKPSSPAMPSNNYNYNYGAGYNRPPSSNPASNNYPNSGAAVNKAPYANPINPVPNYGGLNNNPSNKQITPVKSTDQYGSKPTTGSRPSSSRPTRGSDASTNQGSSGSGSRPSGSCSGARPESPKVAKNYGLAENRYNPPVNPYLYKAPNNPPPSNHYIKPSTPSSINRPSSAIPSSNPVSSSKKPTSSRDQQKIVVPSYQQKVEPSKNYHYGGANLQTPNILNKPPVSNNYHHEPILRSDKGQAPVIKPTNNYNNYGANPSSGQNNRFLNAVKPSSGVAAKVGRR